ncbi:MAG: peptide chain release factor 2 [Phenylobacterium sp.]|uniref:peptide chain release factor 2 n=1 Tax=Phenylobacterium sp. TaxID=1871053 RepID=UPI0025CE747A|nr:peptide chain release factor 2 [Phenylobacterium sp.]MCA6226686.1 peptide chain release factor 2 [Phenylobacterium sp.]MCA6232217.1 peptide chain release factor 2 [Phenylobacterium sp.]MCA6233928.1 peptide chain release factor 2 [Phenylobacterium sp.]MCA6250595.1 peptide chain release factor 2 [Phenylobacterium sp.]MCA6256714.1 peptide chain release factor 2 [Phenylobacterium sp.]
MRADVEAAKADIEQSVALLRRRLDWDVALRKLHELNARVEDPTLWDRPDEAQAVSRERSRLAASVEAVIGLERDLGDAIGYAELADEENDEASLEEARSQLKAIRERAARAELEALLSGEADGNDAFLEVNSGAGGTESCDWAGMLLRMYTRWAHAHGMTVDFLEETPGEQAGIKSATIQIKGPNAYGWLKTEAGVHRLVRISPFDAAAKRHTSFASVWVYPVVDDAIVIDINPSDVRTDTYRASGAGGQHINKTDSAVRLTHVPTGVVVACQMGRSQHQNREEAWKMLRARLYELELQKREAEAQALQDQKTDIGWGHQIRSYVLQPYQMVKDLRTQVETSDTQGVLDGDLDGFMGASLAQRVGVTRES